MPFHRLTDDERRQLCRTTIESLELWLRRLIEDRLSSTHGSNYLEATDDHGNHLINSGIRRRLAERRSEEPGRYPRLIDAAVLDDEIDIICNPNLYRKYFGDPLMLAFPEGAAEARTFLKRILPARNALSHANPISIRQCEQVICYSHDIVDSWKEHYTRKHMVRDYNVPTIVLVRDSFGNTLHPSQMMEMGSGRMHINFARDPRFFLRPGDTLSVEVEIDATFPVDSYSPEWTFERDDIAPSGAPTHVVIPIEERHVRETVIVTCRLATNRNWHRLGRYDDGIDVAYKVLPPLE